MKLQLCVGNTRIRYFIVDCTTSIPRRSQREPNVKTLFKLVGDGVISCNDYSIECTKSDSYVIQERVYSVIAEADSIEELQNKVAYLFL